jgi:exonuclease SbcC
MISKIEIKNFQSHKNTVIDFKSGVNVFCGESDNGKTAIIRAIRWVVENRPLGIDKLNSSWNDGFKDDMSVKLWLSDDVWVERIRNKSINGYRYFRDGKEVTLEATGTDVPQIVTDILCLNDVNFQFQMDAPYLLSMSASEASKYFNRIIHLDTIDDTLSVADSDKRNLNSEKKVVESDIKKYKQKLEELEWLDEAENIQIRVDKYDSLIRIEEDLIQNLETSISDYEKVSSDIKNFDEEDSLISEIESIRIEDYSDFETSISDYEKVSSDIKNFDEEDSLISEIESIRIEDYSDFETSISEYMKLEESLEKWKAMLKPLEESLPETCPLCGNKIDKYNFGGC